MKILCLFLQHGAERYPLAFSSLREWYRDTLPEVACDYWIIDNSLAGAGPFPAPAESVALVAGENSSGEFSGWEKFLREHTDLLSGYDLVHFVTSAFQQNYVRYLRHVNAAMLQVAATTRLCLGHLDYYEMPVRLGSNYSASWIRTCFFFMSPSTVATISDWVYCREPDLVFSSGMDFRANGFIDDAYCERISGWLAGGPQQGVIYHSPAVEIAGFRRKTVAIINEHGFSVSLRRAGIALLDFGFAWLAGTSAYPARLLAATPILAQLKLRYNYLAGWPQSKWEEAAMPSGPQAWKEHPAFCRWYEIMPYGISSDYNSHLGPGWSQPEPHHCWSETRQAFLRFVVEPVATQVNVALLLEAYRSVNPAGQSVLVSCNGCPVVALQVTDAATHVIPIPYTVHLGLHVIILQLEMPDAVSPQSLGDSGDTRLLGIQIRAACLSPTSVPGRTTGNQSVQPCLSHPPS